MVKLVYCYIFLLFIFIYYCFIVYYCGGGLTTLNAFSDNNFEYFRTKYNARIEFHDGDGNEKFYLFFCPPYNCDAILAEVFQSNIEREDFFSIHLLFDQRQSSSSGVVSENP